MAQRCGIQAMSEMSDKMDIQTLQNTVVEFARARDWEQFHDVKNLSMALASEVGELNAILRWVRNDGIETAMTQSSTREAMKLEIGDVAILLLLLCDRTETDLGQAVIEKLQRNALKYPILQSRGMPDPPLRTLGAD